MFKIKEMDHSQLEIKISKNFLSFLIIKTKIIIHLKLKEQKLKINFN